MIGACWGRAAAICLLGISLFACAAAPAGASAIVPGATQTGGTLAGGGRFVLRRDPTVGNAVLELWFRAPSAGYDEKTPGIGRLALTAAAASAPAHGTPFFEAVARAGGRLSLNVYPDIADVVVSVPAPSAGLVLRAMTQAYFEPQLTQEGLKRAVQDTAVAAAEGRFSADRILHDALFARLFAAGPAHYAPTPSSLPSLTSIPLAQVASYAARAFRSQNAVLTLAGNVDASLTAYASATSAGGSPMDAPFDSTPTPQPRDQTAPAAVPGVGMGWLGPPIADSRAATALDMVADYLFNAQSGSIVRAVRQAYPTTYVNGQFITLHDPGVMLVTVSGANAQEVQSRIVDALAELTKPLHAQTFAAARTAFEYHILSDLQTPVNQADNFGWYAVEGNAAYAPGDATQTYLHNLESLDPHFVAQTVRRYLTHPTVVRLLTSSAAQGSTAL